MGMVEELERLAQLHASGVLTDDEFAQAKRRVLGGEPTWRAPNLAAGLRQFRRVPRDQWLGGVCTGLAEVTGLPVWLFRAGFIVLAAAAGVGVAVYVALWLLAPEALPEDLAD